MKKIAERSVLLALTVTLSTALSGCNKDIIDTNYTFKKAIIVIGNEKIDVNIKQWRDFDGDQMQVTDEHGQVYLTHSANVLLLKK
ncbi:hypothetical protein LY28_03525 [Ruminiclostridium sufflavum DSM 19573]|uniref:Uncharacterized protein n=1 Tax=Ruminiclostridium sufflavum DSM 19573 TaxID=1121337 RepID=A0A318XSP4_9FIRM|nr:hypothetical protein [Ruminiclostridium sufflavum]PYG84904.1 hypothetical protein LY28_03525 [Ruminiclostridium sufflavum DSM 19573]